MSTGLREQRRVGRIWEHAERINVVEMMDEDAVGKEQSAPEPRDAADSMLERRERRPPPSPYDGDTSSETGEGKK